MTPAATSRITPALGGDPGARADLQMAGQPGLTAQGNEVVEARASRDTRLSDNDAATTNLHVVPDLYQIINLAARADHGIGSGTAVDRRIGADLDIVADDDTAELRNLEMAFASHGVAEAILADPRAGVDRHPIADQCMADAGAGADHAIVADHHPRPDHGIGADMAADADLGAAFDHRSRFDAAPIAQRRIRIDLRARRNPRVGRRRRIEGPGPMA